MPKPRRVTPYFQKGRSVRFSFRLRRQVFPIVRLARPPTAVIPILASARPPTDNRYSHPPPRLARPPTAVIPILRLGGAPHHLPGLISQSLRVKEPQKEPPHPI